MRVFSCCRLLILLSVGCGRIGYEGLAADQDSPLPDARVAPGADASTASPDALFDAQGTQSIVFDGSLLPQAQGFTVFDNIDMPSTIDVSTDGSSVAINTFGLPTGSSGPMTMFHKDLGLSLGAGFEIEWSLRVVQADPHNSFDAGVTVMVSYSPAFGASGEREQMIYFDEGEIGWGDETDSYPMDTTDAFHTYRLTVLPNGDGELTVDGVSALTRTGWVLNSGVLGFGDQTNDVGVDGNFLIEYISIAGTE